MRRAVSDRAGRAMRVSDRSGRAVRVSDRAGRAVSDRAGRAVLECDSKLLPVLADPETLAFAGACSVGGMRPARPGRRLWRSWRAQGQ